MLPNPDAWRGAVAILNAGGGISARPAAFVFLQDAGRLVWVEPSYADPMGAGAPAMHAAAVTGPDQSGRGILCAGDGWVATLLPYDPTDHRDLIGDALDWFAGWLRNEGRTWDQERARMAAMITTMD